MSDLTIEQIQEAIKANPSLEQSIVTTALQTETGKSVLNNHLATSKTDIYNEATKGAYTNVDAALKGLGYEKPEGIKSTDYLATVIKELSTKASSVDSTAAEKEDAKKLAEALKSDFSTKESEYLSKIEQLQKANQDILIKAEINTLSFDLDPNISEAVSSVFLATQRDILLRNAKVVDGKTIYYDEDGKPYLNDLRDYATAKEILTKKLEPILKKEPTAGGGAGQEKKPTTSIKGGAIISDNLNKATTRATLFAAFNSDAKRQALVQGSEDFNKVWNETKKHYSFNDMPEE